MRARLLWPALMLASTSALTSALAANGIDVRRGDDRIEFGSCVPSLTVENKSGETVDFLEVDLVVSLVNGQERTVALRSAYRDGVHYPIAPGGKAVLKQQLDLERAIGAPCGEVKARRVTGTICELAGGKKCTAAVSVVP